MLAVVKLQHLDVSTSTSASLVFLNVSAMFSKKNLLAASAMLYLDDVLEEEQVLSIFSDITRKNPPFPYWKFDRIEVQLEDMSEAEVKAEFRFAPYEISLLSQALRIPEKFTCPNGTVASGEEGLLMFLKRFAYPCRLSDMLPRFGRSVPEISLILAEVTDHIVSTQGHLLQDLDQPWLQPNHLEEFARAIHQKGAALDNCWGFVDGTIRPVCRPGENQRVIYNGHKRVHCLKFQSVVAPNGMIANLFGPIGKVIFDLHYFMINYGKACLRFRSKMLSGKFLTPKLLVMYVEMWPFFLFFLQLGFFLV